MDIGIIGVGMVGGALRRWFEANTQHNLHLYDPPKRIEHNLNNCSVIFICVPVPTKEAGDLDFTILEKSILICPLGSTIFIKSTVLPGTCDKLSKKYKIKLYSCPEFLTERQADTDMNTLPILSGHPDYELMQNIFPTKKIMLMKNAECELAKYTHNCFGAMKVTFFNTIYEQCEKLRISYDNVLNAALSTGYINKMHTMVPGPDNQFGYGGACFPKDVKAFNKYLDYQSRVCHGTQIDNYKFRGKRIKGW